MMDGKMFRKFASLGRVAEVPEWHMDILADGTTRIRSKMDAGQESRLYLDRILDATVRALGHTMTYTHVTSVTVDEAISIELGIFEPESTSEPKPEPTDETTKAKKPRDVSQRAKDRAALRAELAKLTPEAQKAYIENLRAKRKKSKSSNNNQKGKKNKKSRRESAA